ncbi:MAG: hypothetical protein U0232_03415 [Thermomicrobiales bacterium]
MLRFQYARNPPSTNATEKVGKTYRITAFGVTSSNYDIRYDPGTRPPAMMMRATSRRGASPPAPGRLPGAGFRFVDVGQEATKPHRTGEPRWKSLPGCQGAPMIGRMEAVRAVVARHPPAEDQRHRQEEQHRVGRGRAPPA